MTDDMDIRQDLPLESGDETELPANEGEGEGEGEDATS
jgi:hypothetical protein